MDVLNKTEIEFYKKELPLWEFFDDFIQRKLVLSDFKEAISKMVEIGEVCEEMNHHPDWSNSYNKIIIKLTTHDAGGITKKDIQLANKIDQVV